jgi:hypothetical protein
MGSIDNNNKLVWQDNKFNATEKMSYKNAIAYCQSLSIESKQAWRIPYPEEFEAVKDYNRTPAINTIFKYCAADGYWANASSSANIEWVDFEDGSVHKMPATDKQFNVRCVRSK